MALVIVIPFEEIETDKNQRLGSGGFAQVFAGTWKKPDPYSETLPIAIKKNSRLSEAIFISCASELSQDSHTLLLLQTNPKCCCCCKRKTQQRQQRKNTEYCDLSNTRDTFIRSRGGRTRKN
jgi:hypothetical protein